MLHPYLPSSPLHERDAASLRSECTHTRRRCPPSPISTPPPTHTHTLLPPPSSLLLGYSLQTSPPRPPPPQTHAHQHPVRAHLYLYTLVYIPSTAESHRCCCFSFSFSLPPRSVSRVCTRTRCTHARTEAESRRLIVLLPPLYLSRCLSSLVDSTAVYHSSEEPGFCPGACRNRLRLALLLLPPFPPLPEQSVCHTTSTHPSMP